MDAYLFLAASLLPLVLGPLVARWAERSATATASLDAFVAVTVGGIALVHVLPHAYAGAGVTALVAMAVGFVLPLGLGHHHGDGPRKLRPAVVLVAFLGLGVHAALDGLALFGPAAASGGPAQRAPPADGAFVGVVPGSEDHQLAQEHRHASASLLAWAVILHRLPMALAIWWIAAPALGRRIATGLLGMIGAATLAGFVLGGQIWGLLSSQGLAVLQAAIAGMLLHMVLGHHEPHGDEPLPPVSRAVSTVGVLAGLALLSAMTRLHPLEHSLAGALSAGAAFMVLAFAAAPALLLSYVVLAGIQAYAPAGFRALWRGSPTDGRDGPEPGRPLMVRCARLVLRSEIQLPALAMTLALLGPLLLGSRLAVVLVLAGLALLSIKASVEAEGVRGATTLPGDPQFAGASRPGLLTGLRFAFGEAFDRTIPWILLGLGIAAFLESMTDFAALQSGQKPIQIALLAVLGIPLYLHGLGATPVLAILAHKGFGLGGLLAFLAAGLAVSGARRLKAVGGRGLALSFAVRMLVLVFVAAYAVNAPAPVPDLHQMASREPGPLAVLSCLVLAVLVLVSLYRQGFRRFLRPSAAMERWHGAGL